jgi:hypothetical protein
VILVVVGVAVLAAALGAALAAPVRITVSLDADSALPHAAASVAVRWLFLSWRTAPTASTPPEGAPAEVARPPRARRRHRSGSRRAMARARAVALTPGFVRRALRLALEVLRVALPSRAQASVRIGFDDPALTGECAGMLAALNPVVARWRDHVVVEPDFEGAILVLRARVDWRIRPVAIVGPIGRFVVSPVAWRAGWAALRAR